MAQKSVTLELFPFLELSSWLLGQVPSRSTRDQTLISKVVGATPIRGNRLPSTALVGT